MKTMITTTLIAATFLAAAALPAQAGTVAAAYDKWTLYSDATVACIEADSMKLTPGQQVYLSAILDDDFANEPAARAKAGLGLAEIVQVHGFVWAAGPSCVLKS
jgi:hypothetical protein